MEALSTTRDTPLCLAAYFGHAAAVRLLLSRGADATAADDEGALPGDRFDDGVPEAAIAAVKAIIAGHRAAHDSAAAAAVLAGAGGD